MMNDVQTINVNATNNINNNNDNNSVVNSSKNENAHDENHQKLLCKLISSNGANEENGHSVQLDTGITKDQLNLLCKQLQGQDDANIDIDDEVSYAFFVKGFEVGSSLIETLGAIAGEEKIKLDELLIQLNEQTLTIEYREQAIFKVQHATRCSSTNEGHDREIVALQFSPDGSRIATGSGDKTVRIWDTSMNSSFEPCEGHPGWVMCLEWSPDGHILMSGCRGFAVHFWSQNGEKIFENCRSHSNWISCLCWRPFHLESKPKSTHSVSGSKDGSVSIWSQESKSSIRKLYTQGKNSAITCIKWTGSDRIIASSEDRNIYVWKFKNYQLVHKVQEHAHWVNSLSLNSDFILRTGGFDPKYLLDDPGFNLESLEPQKQQEIAKKRYQQFQNSIGERLASASDDRTICLWALKNSVKNKSKGDGSQNDENEPKKAKNSSNKSELTLIKKLAGHQGTVIHVCFSPNGFYLASASFDKSIRIWNGTTGAEIAVLRSHVLPVYRTVWSPDSRYLLSGSSDSTIKIWSDLTNRKVKNHIKKDLPGHADEVYAVDWSPSGSKAASGGKDRLLKFWE